MTLGLTRQRLTHTAALATRVLQGTITALAILFLAGAVFGGMNAIAAVFVVLLVGVSLVLVLVLEVLVVRPLARRGDLDG